MNSDYSVYILQYIIRYQSLYVITMSVFLTVLFSHPFHLIFHFTIYKKNIYTITVFSNKNFEIDVKQAYSLKVTNYKQDNKARKLISTDLGIQ